MKIQIGKICTLKSGTTLKEEILNDDGEYPYIKVSDMNLVGNEKYIVTANSYVNNEINTKMLFPKGTVLFPKRGGAIGTNKKRIASRPVCADLNTMGVIPGNQIRSLYLYYFFQNIDFGTLYNGSSVPQINNSDIAPMELELPSLEEQDIAISKLEKVDSIIQLRKKELTNLDELIKARFVELFGDIKTNSKNWDKVQMKNVVDIRGRVGWKGYKKEDLRESGPLVLGATHLTDSGDLDLSSPVYLSREKYDESPEIVLQRYDLIFTQRGNTIGKVGLVDQDIGEATINPCVLILRPQKVNPIYLKRYFVMDETKDDMWLLNSGSAQPMITQKGIGEYYLMLPPEELQDSFAEFVKQVDKSKFGRVIAYT